jgi:hypothetical protein
MQLAMRPRCASTVVPPFLRRQRAERRRRVPLSPLDTRLVTLIPPAAAQVPGLVGRRPRASGPPGVPPVRRRGLTYAATRWSWAHGRHRLRRGCRRCVCGVGDGSRLRQAHRAVGLEMDPSLIAEIRLGVDLLDCVDLREGTGSRGLFGTGPAKQTHARTYLHQSETDACTYLHQSAA